MSTVRHLSIDVYVDVANFYKQTGNMNFVLVQLK